MIKAIVAMDEKGGIAKDGKIPWHNKEDLALFKKLTIGSGYNAIVMGRKTKQSLEDLKVFPLKDRVNIIMTSKPVEVNEICHINQAIDLDNACENVWIIGGARVYDEFFKLQIPEEIHISVIDGNFDCDKSIDIGAVQEHYTKVNEERKETFTYQIWKKN